MLCSGGSDEVITPQQVAAAGSAPRFGNLPVLIARWTTGGLLALAAFTVLSTLYQVARTHNDIPQADEWFSLDLYDRILRQGDALRLLFEPHNEHRLFFPRLVLFSDYLFFGGCGLFDQTIIFATQALETGLFVWLAGQTGAGSTARAALGAVAVVLLFSLYQSENFVWGFQVQFVGVFACASLSCTLFAFGVTGRLGHRSGWASTAGALALVPVATFTMANGLLTGPVLVVLAVIARARRSIVLAAAAVAAAAVAAFSTGYHPGLDPQRESVLDLLVNLPRVLAFAAGYLGNFMRFGATSQIALGGCGLAAVAGVTGIMALRGDRDAGRLSLLGIALFAAGSALATAAGRSGAGLQYIESSRYSTGAAVFWTATLLNAWSVSRRSTVGAVARASACFVMALLLEASWTVQLARGSDMERRAIQYDAMEDAMLLGLHDVPALLAFEEPADKAREMEAVLRRLHLSIFGSRDARLFGRPLSDVEVPGAAPLACAGEFEAAIAAPALGADGVAVAGTSSLRSRLRHPSRVYLVDTGTQVVGFAHTGFGDGRWAGYARARPGAELSAWAMSGAGRPCRLGTIVVSSGSPGG